MLSEEEKQLWIKKLANVVNDDDEDRLNREIESLPAEKGDEISELLFQIFKTEPFNDDPEMKKIVEDSKKKPNP
jgi:hypothetical protein